MKLEIILAIAWTTLCIGERLQRSTVLTDESKRVLEHFDFSNFDKQEALNYIDRQRYENQIRGKRSHNKCKRHHVDRNKELFSGKDKADIEYPNEIENDPILTSEIFENPFAKQQTNFSNDDIPAYVSIETTPSTLRNQRHRKRKRKRKSKKEGIAKGEMIGEDADGEERRFWKRKRRKRRRHYWDHWTEWSPCSVTCGRGRKIRWRKCVVKSCRNGELEMGEKTCQLPACSLLTKLLGI